MARLDTTRYQADLVSLARIRNVVTPRAGVARSPDQAPGAAASSARRGIITWALTWGLFSVVLCTAAFLWGNWGSARPAAAAPPVLVLTQSSTYDAVRCAQVAETWQAAGRALDQYRVTQLWEDQADAERLRDQARADGRLYCIGDPIDR